MDLFVFQRAASGQPWQQLNVILGPDELLGSNAAGELGAIPKSNFILSSSIGQLGGVCPLDGSGKVPVEFLPDKAVEVTIVVANQAARFALTTVAVQSGDRVKQSDDGSVWTLIDEANMGNANGWVKTGLVDWTDIQNKPTSFDTQELDYNLATGAVQVVTVTKKLTIVNVEVGTSSGHTATLRVDGGTGGEIVVINRLNYNGSTLRGSLIVQSQNQAGTWLTVTTLVAGAGGGSNPSRAVVQRAPVATMQAGGTRYSLIATTNTLGKLSNVSGSATGVFNQIGAGVLAVHGGLPAIAEIVASSQINDGDMITLFALDEFGTTVWGPLTFEFDENGGGLNSYGNVPVYFASGDSVLAQLQNLATAMAGQGFSGSFYSEGGTTWAKLTIPHDYYSLNSSGYSSVQLAASNSPQAAVDPNQTLVPTATALVAITVQCGGMGNPGPDQVLKIKAAYGGEARTLLTIPANAAENSVYTMANLEPGAQKWLLEHSSFSIVVDSEGAVISSGRAYISVAYYQAAFVSLAVA